MSQLVSDDFNRADNTDLGTTWDPNLADASNLGLRITSNAALEPLPGSVSDSSETYNAITWPSDQYTEVTYGATAANGAGAGIGPTCRAINGTLTFYRAVGNASGYGLSSAVAGTFNTISSGTGTTFAAADTLRLELQGTTWRLKKNGTTFQTSTDSAISAANRGGIGFSSADSGTTATSWAGGDFKTPYWIPSAGSMHPGMSPGYGMLSGRFVQTNQAYNATTTTQSFSYTGVGGLIFAGTGPSIKVDSLPARTGGLVFSNTAAVIKNATPSPAGGIVFAGTSTKNIGKQATGSGGLIFAGTAAEIRIDKPLASGGYVFGGSAPYSSSGVQSFTYTMSGGIVFGGTGVRIKKITYLPNSGYVFGGTAPYIPSSVGGVTATFRGRRFYGYVRRGR